VATAAAAAREAERRRENRTSISGVFVRKRNHADID